MENELYDALPTNKINKGRDKEGELNLSDRSDKPIHMQQTHSFHTVRACQQTRAKSTAESCWHLDVNYERTAQAMNRNGGFQALKDNSKSQRKDDGNRDETKSSPIHLDQRLTARANLTKA